MDIRNTARGAWLGMVAGLLMGVTGTVRVAAAEAEQPTTTVAVPKESAAKTSAEGAVSNENSAPVKSGVNKAETKEKEVKRLAHERKRKEIQAAGLLMDLDNLKAFQEREKIRLEAEKAKKSPQETPGRDKADAKAAK